MTQQTVIKRSIEKDLLAHLDSDKITVLYGARQVGKTFLVNLVLKRYLKAHPQTALFKFNLDFPSSSFINPNHFIDDLYSKYPPKWRRLVFIDEAQRVENIGLFIKYIYDKQLNIKFILTGSASLDIKEKIKEPLTGRKKEFFLNPLSLQEILVFHGVNTSLLKTLTPKLLEIFNDYMVYGGYPEVVSARSRTQKKEILMELATSYISKDVATLFNIKDQSVLETILVFLSENTANLFNKETVASRVGISKYEVNKIIEALRKTFVVWSLPPFFKSGFKEMTKTNKLYFYDLGIRNAVLKKMDSKLLLLDKGKVFENAIFLILSAKYGMDKLRFWQNRNQTEVDFVCLKEARRMDAFEVKYQWKSNKLPKNLVSFVNNYHQLVDQAKVVTLDNLVKFL